MIAPQNHRQGCSIQNFFHTKFNIAMTFLGFGVDNIRISEIDHADRCVKIGCIIFVIISTRMTKTEQRGCFAYRAWPKSCTCPPLRPEIKRRPQNGNIRRDSIPIFDIRRFAKSGYSHKRQIQSSRFITVFFHLHTVHMLRRSLAVNFPTLNIKGPVITEGNSSNPIP